MNYKMIVSNGKLINKYLKNASEESTINIGEYETIFIDNKYLKVKKIPSGDFEGRKITEYGDILSLKGKAPFIKQRVFANGILFFENHPKKEEVHITVARTFIPNENNFEYVVHIDGNVKNNHYSNLIWSKFPDLDHEKFNTIPGFSNYKISKNGVVKSYFTSVPLTLKLKKSEHGYMTVKITDDSGRARNMFHHRLVALTYIPNPDNLPCVDHINRIKTDNRPINLRWVTYSENSRNMDNGIYRIEQYNLDGDFIKKFKSLSEILDELQLPQEAENEIKECMEKNKLNDEVFSCHNFIWKRREKEKFIPQEGEIAVQMVKDFGFRSFNYPDHYITNYGNIFNSKGYKLVMSREEICPAYNLSNKGKNERVEVHVLVALFFLPGRTEEKCIVDHLDEDRTNPHISNLEWVSYSENSRRAAHKKKISVNMIDPKTMKVLGTYNSMIEAGCAVDPDNGENISTGISKCCKGLRKTCMGYIWRYAE